MELRRGDAVRRGRSGHGHGGSRVHYGERELARAGQAGVEEKAFPIAVPVEFPTAFQTSSGSPVLIPASSSQEKSRCRLLLPEGLMPNLAK